MNVIPYRTPRLGQVAELVKAELARRTTPPGRRPHPWLDPAAPVLDGYRYGLTPGRLYLGTLDDRWVMAPWEQSLIAIGRTGTGKTRRLIVPNALLWPGVLVATSVKPDLGDIIARCRTHRGQVWVWDPYELVGNPPLWIHRLDHSLVAACEDMRVARRRARALMARTGLGVTDGGLWHDAAIQLVSLLLHAAALRRLPMTTVRSWVARQHFPEAVAIIAERGSKDARDTLEGLKDSRAGRTIDSLWFQVQAALAAMDIPSIERSWTRAASSTWDVRAFLQQPNTLVIVMPEHAQDDVTPLVVCLLEDLREAALALADRSPSRALKVPLLLALDELRHTAPIAAFSTIITTGRSRRIFAIAALQHYDQAEAVWGAEAAGLLWSGATTVVFPDCGDAPVTRRLSELSGPHGVPRITTSRSATGPFARLRFLGAEHTVHYGYVDMPRYSEADISGIPHDRAWVRMPHAPLGLIETHDYAALDPFAPWARMAPVVDVVTSPPLSTEQLDDATTPATTPPAWWETL
jgi:TraM recognition site of TraD and TraG